MSTGDAWAEVWASVSREPVRAGDKPLVVGVLQRLCRVAADALSAMGVGVSVIAEDGDQVSVAASSEVNEKIEELQFIMGEGPCLAAYESRGPVLVPDLAEAAQTRWLGYGPAARDLGVRAVFAFPLQVGAARLGALDVYQDEVGPLSTRAISQALTFAEAALETLLDAQRVTGVTGVTGGEEEVSAADAVGGRPELYQAQGMVMIQLGVSLAEAMSRLRAHAFAHDRRIDEVADDVVAGKLVLEGDSE